MVIGSGFVQEGTFEKLPESSDDHNAAGAGLDQGLMTFEEIILNVSKHKKSHTAEVRTQISNQWQDYLCQIFFIEAWYTPWLDYQFTQLPCRYSSIEIRCKGEEVRDHPKNKWQKLCSSPSQQTYVVQLFLYYLSPIYFASRR